MELFIDGIIFGRQRFGGISKIWEETLPRLPISDVEISLLVPLRHRNVSLHVILEHAERYNVRRDYFYRPRRYLERVSVRSKILGGLHIRDSVDIFHSTFFSTIYKKGVKNVVTVYDMTDEIFKKEFGHRWTPLTIDIKKRVLENADKIIAISNSTKNDILNIYPWIPEERVNVIYMGVNSLDRTTKISLEELNSRYAMSLKERQYFIFVGKRGGYKNFDILCEWFRRYKRRYKEFQILVVGEKTDSNLIHQLEAQGIKKHFIFLDFLGGHELAMAYKYACGLIYPSKYEGFGLPVLEAMDNYCPVICSNRSSLPEVGGEAAIYFDPDSPESLDDAVSTLLSQSRPELERQGLENVKRFSWDEATRELMNVYKDIL